MGGASGGGLFSSDIKRLEEKAKETLFEASGDASRHVFITGKGQEIFTMKPRGGVIAIPYFEEEGTSIVVTALDQELINFTLKK